MKSQNNALENMLLDVIVELRAMGESAKAAAEKSSGEFDRGRQFAMYEVISLIANQVDAFGVDRARIGLDGFSPEDIIV